MNPKEIIKLLVIITIVSFFSLYFTTLGGYYEYNLSQKNTLTEEAIKRFEEDVKQGKEIVASNYIEEEKNYQNKANTIAKNISKFISKTFNIIMKFIFSQLENVVNS